MNNKQEQKAGKYSQQIQANLVVMNQGIDEKRAREIFQEMFNNRRNEFSIEAEQKAKERVDEFEDNLIFRMQKVEGSLEAFADPSFQMMLAKAHRIAAVTTEKNDYDILSGLLIYKVQNGDDRANLSGISKAIDVVNEISNESLLGLTVQYVWSYIYPTSGIISEGLDTLEEIFSSIIINDLPQGREWIEQLDVVNAIRIQDMNKFKNMEDYYMEQMNGYCCLGINKKSNNYIKAIDLLKDIHMENIFVENEMNPKYMRLAITNKKQINTIMKNKVNEQTGENKWEKLNEKEKEVLNQILNMYEKDEESNIKEIFLELIDKRKNLKRVKLWINNIPYSYVITSIGKALAHVNAQQYIHDFPSLV